MAWTTPRTWVDGEIVTAAMMNAHIRDNYGILKLPINDDGRFLGLSSATLADLDGTNLTGLVKPGSSNSHTAGVNDFNGGSATRFVLPVGTDKFDGTGGNKTAGSKWVEGDYLHHVASNQNEWRYPGVFVSTPGGAVIGSYWIESNEEHYIDADGDERKITGTATGMHNDVLARAGSVWVETYQHFVGSAGVQEYQSHDDLHGDSAPSHNDAHSDGHDDTHGDGGAGHDDSHSDGHDDNHGDTHDDVAHDDFHQDHDDEVIHDDNHTDTHDDDHSDTHDDNHGDSHGDSVDHDDAHNDDHSDSHGDGIVGHIDTHGDAPESIGT